MIQDRWCELVGHLVWVSEAKFVDVYRKVASSDVCHCLVDPQLFIAAGGTREEFEEHKVALYTSKALPKHKAVDGVWIGSHVLMI